MSKQETLSARDVARLHDAPIEGADLALVPASESQSLMAVISRAAENPNTNVGNLERLLDMYERVKDRDAKAAYIRALVAMKPKLPVIDRRGRIEVREKTSSGKRDGDIQQSTAYAYWEDIDQAITPILTEYGFVLTFRSGVAQDGKITVTGVLGHNEGHTEETTITLPHDSSGSKNAVQAVGSSTSYGKRYTATLLLNIRTRGEDDDGGKGGADDLIDDDKIQTIMDMLARDGMDKDKFCATLKIEAIADIKLKDYESVIKKINEVSLIRAAQKKKTATEGKPQ